MSVWRVRALADSTRAPLLRAELSEGMGGRRELFGDFEVVIAGLQREYGARMPVSEIACYTTTRHAADSGVSRGTPIANSSHIVSVCLCALTQRVARRAMRVEGLP